MLTFSRQRKYRDGTWRVFLINADWSASLSPKYRFGQTGGFLLPPHSSPSTIGRSAQRASANNKTLDLI